MDGLNSITDIKRFLDDDPEHPLSPQEFQEWWKTLSEEEKEEYKNTELPPSK